MKKITIKDPATNASYTIEYDRDSVVYAESIGFRIQDASTAIATDMVTLFRAGFHKDHPYVPKDTVYAIWDRIPKKQELFMKLMDMFMVPYKSLMDEPDEGDAGNASWEESE